MVSPFEAVLEGDDPQAAMNASGTMAMRRCEKVFMSGVLGAGQEATQVALQDTCVYEYTHAFIEAP
jgi:hypothetical protein